MEPPAKRQRLSHTRTSRQQHEDDELDFESENVDHQRDPGLQLAESRAFAAYKLKSTFEHIFEKYERDFTGIGDEIDLRTGEIVVDNGHIQRLGLGGVDNAFLTSDAEDHEQGQPGFSSKPQPRDTLRAGEGDESRASEDRQPPPPSPTQAAATSALQGGNSPGLSTPGGLGTDHRLSKLAFSRHAPPRSSPLSRGAWGPDHGATDPIWRTPRLPSPEFSDNITSKFQGIRYSVPAAENEESIWSLPPSDMVWPLSPYKPAPSPSSRHCKTPRGTAQTGQRRPSLVPADGHDEDEILSHVGSGSAATSPSKPKVFQSAPKNQEVDGENRGETKKSDDSEHSHPGNPAKERKKPPAKAKSIRPVDRPRSKTTIPGVKIGSRVNTTPLDQTSQLHVALVTGKRGPGRPRKNPSHEAPQLIPQQTIPQSTLPVQVDELPRKSSVQQLVIELPRRPEPPGLTEVGDIAFESPPQSTEGNGTPPMSQTKAKASPPRIEHVASSIPNSQALTSLSSSAPAIEPPTEAKPRETVDKALTESYQRNEVDPSYEFSDEESGIPLAKGVVVPTTGKPDARSRTVQTPDLSNVALPRESETAAASEKTQAHAMEGEQRVVDLPIPEVSVLPGISNKGGDCTEVSTTQEDMAGKAATAPQVKKPESAAQELPLNVATDLPSQVSNERTSRPTEQSETAIAVDSAPELPTDSSILPPLQQTSKDEQSTQKNTVLEVPDSDCLDDNLESSLREVSQSLASTQDKEFAAQSPTLPLASETTCSSLMNKKKKKKRKKTKDLRHKTCIPVPEEEHSAIVQLSQAPQAEIDVVGADIPKGLPLTASNKEPEKQKNSISKTTTPQTQILTPQRPSSRRSILSLRPGDAEEDEISLILDSWSTPRTGSALPPRVVDLSSIRKNTLAKLAGSSPLRSRGNIMSPTGIVTSGGGGSGLRFRTAREGFGGMSTPTKRKRLASPGSQAGSLIRTPGGQLRRCGVDGFSCDRDFCFTCLQG
ncbi:hypothetical protein BN1723_009243 [Verticillium longisporum]|uniref:Uncharacterized protein n=2 Tax=Verticillium longisporum TaxID=100787 RepID=A0A0G4KMX2_VERLO|nr:hypothetical protein BN1723_009243 [Verticillium longisporum]CRK24892.1 hypothetical protein BN1708_014058 [Verticillium longisporum]